MLFDVGVLDVSATESSGTSTLVSGKYDAQHAQLVHGEVRLARTGGEAAFVARCVRQPEAVRPAHPGVEVVETGDDAGDAVANHVVVGLEAGPVDALSALSSLSAGAVGE